MSFPPYPKYKDSGVEWLGQVPEHWDLKRLKFISRVPIQNGIGAASDTDNPEFPRYIRITDIKSSRELHTDTFRSLPIELALTAGFSVGDILFACVGATFGKSYLHCVEVGPVCYAGYLARFSPNTTIDPRFISYWSESRHYWAQLNANVIQSTVQNFSASKYRELGLPIPAYIEQTAIAEFLDRETAKIDGLVSEQQRLIELLKEKRQAVISHAVTKGLNLNAPLKPSGIEWLGDVPAHWAVVALKHLVSTPIIDGPHESPANCDEGIPFVSAESVSKGFVDFEKIWGYISPDDHALYSKRFLPKRGDILMVKLGATTGVSAIVETDRAFNIWVPLAAIRLKPEIEPRFILHVLRSDNLLRAYENSWTYGTQQTLGLKTISNLRIPLPPEAERREIAKYIDSIVPAFELLTAEALRAIDLLQERRTALISAAVTGQIDVRQVA